MEIFIVLTSNNKTIYCCVFSIRSEKKKSNFLNKHLIGFIHKRPEPQNFTDFKNVICSGLSHVLPEKIEFTFLAYIRNFSQA